MKRFVLAFLAPVAIVAVPVSGFAQDTGVDAPIVVTAKYQRDWDKGHELEAKGLKDLEEANKKLIEYSADVVSAQNKRTSSASRGSNAEQEFRSLTSPVPVFANAKDADRWAEKVANAASEWAKFQKREGNSGDDFSKAVDRQEDAREAVAKAEERVRKGREMKAEAERKSRSL